MTLIERHGAPAQEASGNPAGLLRPIVNKEDAVNARLSRPALDYARRHFNALVAEAHALPWQQSGVLQLARDETEAGRFAAIVALHDFDHVTMKLNNAGSSRVLANRRHRRLQSSPSMIYNPTVFR